MRHRLLMMPALLLLALVGCSAAESEAPASQPGTPAMTDPIAVTVMDFMLDPADLEVAGPTVAFEVTNDGPTPHNLTVRDSAGEILMGTEDLSVGENATISGELAPGDYTIFCALAGHESLGMSGTLTVTGP